MRQISYAQYLDKVYGAWAGKCAGGMIGAAQENNKNVLHYTFENVFPDKIPPNDDFDLQILFLQDVLEKKGFNFDHNDLGESFEKYNVCWANEYRYAIKNMNAGVMPPQSGLYRNDFFKNSQGCPIRSELWGLIAVGNPTLAASFAEMDGCIDHDRESIEAEKFYAVLESLAFFENDLVTLINKSKEYVTKDSETYRCIEFTAEQALTVESWATARENLIMEFGSSDASYAVVNLGLTLLALFYGKGSFSDTMLLAVNGGYDTDCTAATAGSVIGIMLGKSKTDPAWLEKIGETFIVGTVRIVRERNTLTELSEDTAALAYALYRDKLTDVKITDIPEDFVCNIPEYRAEASVKIMYGGEPSVSAVKDCAFTVEITNKSDKKIKGDLSFSTDFPISVTLEKTDVEIGAGATAAVKGVARLTSDEDFIPTANHGKLTAHFGSYKREVKLGFYTESKYRVYGPYFDNYDTKKYDHDIYGEKNQGGRMEDIFPMFNGYVNIDRPYIENEGTPDERMRHKVIYSADDRIPVESCVKYKGPCCVYVERRIFCEDERLINMFIGYTSPYKMYLNGELKSEYKGENVCWMPFNGFAALNLKKGENRLVFKLTRLNGEFEFSTMITRKQEMDNLALPDYKKER